MQLAQTGLLPVEGSPLHEKIFSRMTLAVFSLPAMLSGGHVDFVTASQGTSRKCLRGSDLFRHTRKQWKGGHA